MTTFEQDKILLNDILERNYYKFFREQKKSISLSFFYDFRYTNLKYIEDLNLPISNINNIKNNFIQIIKWYQDNNFCCDIKIEDDFWLYEKNFYNFIFDYLLKSSLSCKNIIIKTKVMPILSILPDLQTYINLFKKQNINIIFSLTTDLIDIGNVKKILDLSFKNFIFKNNFKLKIVINPNNFAYFEETIFDLLEFFKEHIYLYEEANYGWTDHKIKEYFIFLGKYTEYFYKIYKTDFLNQLFQNNISLFHLQDKGILNGTGSCVGNCSFYQSLCILLEDLTLNLCPKFQFDDQIIGQYIIEKDTLIAEPKILELISMKVHLKRHSTSHCENCILVPFCDGCCSKSSYDICLNPIIPVRQFCEMQNLKYQFLFQMLLQNHLISEEQLSLLSISDLYKTYLLNLIAKLKEGA